MVIFLSFICDECDAFCKTLGIKFYLCIWLNFHVGNLSYIWHDFVIAILAFQHCLRLVILKGNISLPGNVKGHSLVHSCLPDSLLSCHGRHLG